MINKRDVLAAIKAITQDGLNPTMEMIRKRLGDKGSFGTIQPILRDWKAEQERRVNIVAKIPKELEVESAAFVSRLWLSASKLADERVHAVEAKALALREQLQADLDAYGRENARLEQELDETQKRAVTLQHSENELKAHVIRSDERLKGAGRELDVLQQDLRNTHKQVVLLQHSENELKSAAMINAERLTVAGREMGQTRSELAEARVELQRGTTELFTMTEARDDFKHAAQDLVKKEATARELLEKTKATGDAQSLEIIELRAKLSAMPDVNDLIKRVADAEAAAAIAKRQQRETELKVKKPIPAVLDERPL